MEDPVEINRRIERLVKRVRRRDDYGRLLAAGEVIQPVERIEDPDEWRVEIKRQARADRIKVRTGQTAGKLWAFLEGASDRASTRRGGSLFPAARRTHDAGWAPRARAEGRAPRRGGGAVSLQTMRRRRLRRRRLGAVDRWGSIRGGLSRLGATRRLRRRVALSAPASVLLLLGPRPAADFHRVVEEVSAPDSVVQEVDVGAQSEGWVGVAEPGLDLLDVLAVGEEQRRAGVAEGVEAHPRHLRDPAPG